MHHALTITCSYPINGPPIAPHLNPPHSTSLRPPHSTLSQCDDCYEWLHQPCALFNPFACPSGASSRDLSLSATSSGGFTCPLCRLGKAAEARLPRPWIERVSETTFTPKDYNAVQSEAGTIAASATSSSSASSASSSTAGPSSSGVGVERWADASSSSSSGRGAADDASSLNSTESGSVSGGDTTEETEDGSESDPDSNTHRSKRKKRSKSPGAKEKAQRWDARSLPICKMAQFIERKVQQQLAEQGGEAAKMQDSVIVRVVSNVQREWVVPTPVRKHFLLPGGGEVRQHMSYRSKAIMLFQNFDGIDICLFCMYVHEYNGSAPAPNKKQVYISYLDSVEYFRPRVARTAVYHEILMSYLAWARKRGFTTAHLWACPPQRGNNFIFWCHPQHQRTPSKDRLLTWYVGTRGPSGCVARASPINPSPHPLNISLTITLILHPHSQPNPNPIPSP